jgi:hypothetical protein
MLDNPKFQQFIDHYFTITDPVEAMVELKDFMFSLPTDELMDFMLDTGKAHNDAVKQVLENPNATNLEKQKLQSQFDNLLTTFARPVVFSKAA